MVVHIAGRRNILAVAGGRNILAENNIWDMFGLQVEDKRKREKEQHKLEQGNNNSHQENKKPDQKMELQILVRK